MFVNIIELCQSCRHNIFNLLSYANAMNILILSQEDAISPVWNFLPPNTLGAVINSSYQRILISFWILIWRAFTYGSVTSSK